MQFDGSVELTRLHYILRDHDADKLETRKARFLANMAFLNEKYGAGTVKVSIVDNYRNMKEMLLPHMHVVEEAKQAMIQAGVTPHVEPIRGGTDGARLSWDGLPCPNLSTGGYNYHGVREWIPADSLEAMTNVLVTLTESFAE